MSYNVLVAELRAAAGLYEGVKSDLGATAVVVDNITPESLGHVELAAWLTAVAEQIGNAHSALSSGAGSQAESLRVAADGYETTDDDQGARYTMPYPFGGGPSPTAPIWTPPFGPPVQGPVYVPPTGG